MYFFILNFKCNMSSYKKKVGFSWKKKRREEWIDFVSKKNWNFCVFFYYRIQVELKWNLKKCMKYEFDDHSSKSQEFHKNLKKNSSNDINLSPNTTRKWMKVFVTMKDRAKKSRKTLDHVNFLITFDQFSFFILNITQKWGFFLFFFHTIERFALLHIELFTIDFLHLSFT